MVDLTEGHGELEPIGIVRDRLFDNIGAEPFVIKFLHQTDSPDVLQAKPHLVADIILWGFVLLGIIESGHVISCLD